MLDLTVPALLKDFTIMVPLAFSILQNVFVLLIHWVADALSLSLKRPEREADNSPPSNAEITNTLGYISTSHMRS